MLQAADVGVGRRQFSRRQALVEYLVDGIFRLQQCAHGRIVNMRPVAFARLALVVVHRIVHGDIEDAGKGMLHLGNRVILQNDDGLAVLFGLLQAFWLAAVVVLDRDDRVGIMLVVGDDNR